MPLDLYGKHVFRNAASLRACLGHLAGGGLLIVFPAGRISRFSLRSGTVQDTEWKPAVGTRLIRAAAQRVPTLSIIRAYIAARNSAIFHIANAIHSSLGLALLPRQFLKAKGSEVTVRCGSPVAGGRFGRADHKEFIAHLRWRTDILANRCDLESRRRQAGVGAVSRRRIPEPIVGARAAESLRAEIRNLPSSRKLSEGDGLQVYIAIASEVPNITHEIGRLREEAFRAAGEGTGRPADLDRFNGYYRHLFLWKDARGEVAGAYRVAQTDIVLRSYGSRGLYTATLFDFGQPLMTRIGPALELGRSFVRLEYPRSFAPLLLLWKAIGRFVVQNPQYRILFGPVSISNAYSSLSRELMVSFREKRAKLDHWSNLVANRTPFRSSHRIPDLSRFNLDTHDVSDLVADIEGDGRGVPVLLRHYLNLGGRLLGFNLAPGFSKTLDALIVVDLVETERSSWTAIWGKRKPPAFLFTIDTSPHGHATKMSPRRVR